ncbi:hypothetical protein NN3_48970 [Nocardia neocaledoniensis NBRC 108232]|uniref:Tetratricopeptide repeat protein n=1 Tax=Nocardia neocaledoniensis TaxID=236511 RepID=A0A317P1B5_9NOCA|nr:hypothetical protein [Nocardia neocaledoniensis]PWV81227.1 hypothetical protein DFR69_101567 [Nocardia neocaledoniensis]GEM33890.1 hypothetical protein NN3_48970 [Nocardia neocaledoniensis NBRC 108232]
MNAAEPAARRPDRQVVKILALVAFLVLALAYYFIRLGSLAIAYIAGGEFAGVALGIGMLLLPIVGIWIVWATLQAAFAHQRLARRIDEEGLEVDTSQLPRRPSGRIERAAADELFARIKTEWEGDPDNWRSSYRLARAYDYAGDRTRARETMRRAVALEKLEREA